MTTCGTCKFKGAPITKFDDDKMEDVATKYFLCDKIPHKTYDHNPVEKAYVKDGSDYYAALCVDSDFGCNQWEAA